MPDTPADLLARFGHAAAHPEELFQGYLADGRKVVLTAPYYAPAEIVHAMGLVPMGAWGGDVQLDQAKRYFPAFICSIVQSIVELGMKGTYDGASALIVPSLCDALKVLGQNWKYAVPGIPFIPMTYPQNRRLEAADRFTIASFRRVIRDLEEVTGATFADQALARSIRLYDDHNAIMRSLAAALPDHPEVTPAQRSAIYKSAHFMTVEDHLALVGQLLSAWVDETGPATAPASPPLRLVTSGVLLDSPGLLQVLAEQGFQVVADDVAAESRPYATDAPPSADALTRLAWKHRDRGNCSVLFDPAQNRIRHLVDLARDNAADGVLIALTKFCDPEEFDVPHIKAACDDAGRPVLVVEVDRQMVDYAQARTALTAFAELLKTRKEALG
jgi:benzoyl-CoA reductase/2-hydroxyglutaryl-CoA dehydratase subunit BcrC/BadD/HgdB